MGRRKGVISPERVIQIRHSLGLAQTDLEDILGLGPKVITRWETGRVTVPSPSGLLLLLLEQHPELLETLKKVGQY